MGLVFQTPIELNDLDDRIKVVDGKLILRTYGLPMIFWGYLLAVFAVLFFMILAIKVPLMTVLKGDDQINRILGICVLTLFIVGPSTLLAFYFYEKEISKKGQQLIVKHKVFFIPFKTYKLSLDNQEIVLEHFLDSPNMAVQEKRDGMKGFENRGYFKLVAKNQSGKDILIDRNGRRGEMKKLKSLLDQY
jgi:hypothetical protein